MHTPKTSPSSARVKKDAVALKAFFAITDKWHLDNNEERTLLGAREATYYRWKRGEVSTLSADTMERISYILGIYKALRILLPNEEAAHKWIKKPNKAPLFGGKSALDKLLAGRVIDLADVRRYLDAERGW